MYTKKEHFLDYEISTFWIIQGSIFRGVFVPWFMYCQKDHIVEYMEKRKQGEQ
jgi:hypothetical protein